MTKRTSFSHNENGSSKVKKKNEETKDLPLKKIKQTKDQLPFKNPNFQLTKKKTWKSVRQVAQAERLQLPPDAPSYLSIETPPPVKPVKKYSDISGQLAVYTDPHTGLYYASVEEYKKIRRLTPDVVQGYLALRGANRI
uniref:INO80 complex subunit C n=1 Tax=Hydra vulgaris TaxID=6087 RepID=T2MBQ3_HYDVU|nr:INO80 complex subunit C-like [Hydra vulgaris]